MRKKIVLWGNGPCVNRGCEAILRSTVNILDRNFPDIDYLSCHGSSDKPNDCELYNHPHLIHRPPINSMLSVPCLFRVYERLTGKVFRFESHLKGTLAVLGLGGDNFSNDYHKLPYKYFSSIKRAYDKKTPFVLWGASTGKLNQDFKSYGLEMLRKAYLITVRESISYNYLRENGLTNVKLVSDPAFVMPAAKPDLKPKLIEFISGGNVLGINFSPLYGKFYSEGMGAWKQCCCEILNVILDRTNLSILLIPHVFKLGNNDEEFMENLLNEYCLQTEPRIMLFPGHQYSAPEIKWVIGKLRFLIGARTHATIAGFSQNIPTISLGYSTKAQGINQDIFGHQEWVISSQNINAGILFNKLSNLIDEEIMVLQKYREVMPEYIKKAWIAGEYLKDSLNNISSLN